MPVIAQLRGLFTQLRESVIAWLTQSAGHVFPEPTTQHGNPTSAETTPQPSQQPQPAPTQPLPKKDRVRKTTRASKSGKGSSTAQARTGQRSTAVGSKSQTPARQTRQPAKPVAKAAPKRAKHTTVAKSPK